MLNESIRTGYRSCYRLFSLCTSAFAAITVVLMAAAAGPAWPADVSEEAGECLGCHEDGEMVKILGNDEVLPLYIEEEDYALSIHGEMDCTECHQDLSLDDHPGEKEIASRDEYSEESARLCLECHDGDRSTAHGIMVDSHWSPPCAECHGAHRIKPVGDWLSSLEERDYCLLCHERGLMLSFQSGEVLSLSIVESNINDSVHMDHDCGDCHDGFSRGGHPVQIFSNAREHTISAAEACRQCHEEKFESLEGSVHFALLEEGRREAPVCTDCHGFHTVGPRATYGTLAGVPCRQCHGEIFTAYAGSMHGKARGDGDAGDAPLCFDCHRAHEVSPIKEDGGLEAACLGCHQEAVLSHEGWLPNARLHLATVDCAVCHAPDADRGINLSFNHGDTGIPLTASEAQELLMESGIGSPEQSGDGFNAFQLLTLLRELNRQDEDADIGLVGRMKPAAGPGSHLLRNKTAAVRECVFCHRMDADPFSTVDLSLVGDDGRRLRYRADSALLTSVVSMGPVGGFYAPGGTRVKILDLLLVLAFMGGLTVPAVHLSARAIMKRSSGRREG